MPNRRNRLEREPVPPQGQHGFTAHSADGQWMFDLRIRADLVDPQLITALHAFIERKDATPLRLVASS